MCVLPKALRLRPPRGCSGSAGRGRLRLAWRTSMITGRKIARPAARGLPERLFSGHTGDIRAALDPAAVKLPAGELMSNDHLDPCERQPVGAVPCMLGEPLTEREIRVLRLLRGSLTLPEIGAELGLSPNTIKTRAQVIYRKLGVCTRQDAITHGQLIGILNSAAAASQPSCLCEPHGSETGIANGITTTTAASAISKHSCTRPFVTIPFVAELKELDSPIHSE